MNAAFKARAKERQTAALKARSPSASEIFAWVFAAFGPRGASIADIVQVQPMPQPEPSVFYADIVELPARARPRVIHGVAPIKYTIVPRTIVTA